MIPYSANFQVFTPSPPTSRMVMNSSASVERLFSLYEGRFSDQQQGALEDYQEASIILHYNALRRSKWYVFLRLLGELLGAPFSMVRLP